MRVLLKNNGGYEFLHHVEFPVEVEAEMQSIELGLVSVHSSELVRIGADKCILDYNYFNWNFYLEEEVDII